MGAKNYTRYRFVNIPKMANRAVFRRQRKPINPKVTLGVLKGLYWAPAASDDVARSAIAFKVNKSSALIDWICESKAF